jgi:eukaryotic-like serine/threonine-protein kinase
MKESWNLDEGAPIADGRTALEPLGGGGRYEVYLVRDEALGGQAVAKILRPDRVEDERALNALRREAGFLERLEHPVLVRGLGSVDDGPLPHLLLEYVDGDNLRDVLATDAALSLGEALDLAVDLLEAADHLARHEVVHLDVKPSNVVMTDPPRLIDLGAARTFAELEARRTPIGTAAYMAPEQCEPAARPGVIGPPADVWGVGATVYHALTGNRPFSKPGPRGSEARERYRQLVEQPRPVPDYVPEPVAREVLRLLAHDPAERPTAAEAARSLELLADEYGEL